MPPDPPHDRSPPPGRSARALSDEALVAAMRRGDAGALDEFLVRFHPLLVRRARQAGFWRGESASEHVLEMLEDVGMLLAAGRARPNRSLLSYLFIVLRRRYFAALEAAERHERFVEEAAEAAPSQDERVLRELCSEQQLREGEGPSWEEPPLTPALKRLATMIDEGLVPEERRMLAWLSHYVPQRQIADWLGITYAAATRRIWRLREWLRATAMEHAVQFEPSERRELRSFFRRSSVRCDEALSIGLDPLPARRARVAEIRADAGQTVAGANTRGVDHEQA